MKCRIEYFNRVSRAIYLCPFVRLSPIILYIIGHNHNRTDGHIYIVSLRLKNKVIFKNTNL